MEWILVPIIAILATILIGLLAGVTTDRLHVFTVLFAIGSFFLCIIAPASYFTSLNDSLKYSTYYDTIIIPNIIEENMNSVTLASSTVSTWELANRSQVINYNTYIATNKYWDSVPIWGFAVYSAPSRLKYVNVINKP